MSTSKVEWAKVKDLLPHEDVIPEIVSENIQRIKLRRKVIPIIVDENSNVILDGHHRYYAFLLLDLQRIPVIYVNYEKNDIIVDTWYRQIKPEFKKQIMYDKGIYCITYKNDKLACSNSIYKLYWLEHKLEQILILNKYEVKKNTTSGLYVPPIPKDCVISIAMKGLRFPPKSTRHVYKFYISKQEIEINEY